jgi:hypothetical protein
LSSSTLLICVALLKQFDCSRLFATAEGDPTSTDESMNLRSCENHAIHDGNQSDDHEIEHTGAADLELRADRPPFARSSGDPPQGVAISTSVDKPIQKGNLYSDSNAPETSIEVSAATGYNDTYLGSLHHFAADQELAKFSQHVHESSEKAFSLDLVLTNEPEHSDIKFQCTFCHIKLSPKSWKRHEESQHLPKRQWVCMPHNQSFVQAECVFCGESYFSSLQSATCKHRVSDCLKRSLETRTFTRKDKLVQHIKSFHGSSIEEEVLDAWSSSTSNYERQWDCGFCDARLDSWDGRAKHIAAHFRQGKDMSMWQSTRLFDQVDL